MTDTIAYIQNALKDLYSRSEINSFIRLIMERVCDLPPYKLLLGKDTELSDTAKRQIQEIVKRLEKQEPLQYILGKADFYGLLFNVNPSVLIPRPETEELVDLIIREHQSPKETPLRILDIGTGSGCIAITLAHHLKQAEVYALDISEEALKTATKNAEICRADVRFLQGNILSHAGGELSPPAWGTFPTRMGETPHPHGDSVSFDGNLQLIVSNPPYIMDKEKRDMERNVLDYEPHLALFVPDDDPLLFYRQIARFGKQALSPGGWLYFEINAQCGDATLRMLQAEGYQHVSLIRDLSNKDRILKAQR